MGGRPVETWPPKVLSQIPPLLGLAKNGGIGKTAVKGFAYNMYLIKLYLGLEIEWRYWGGMF